MEADYTITPGRRWFALYTNPHKEYLVQGLLRDKRVEVYLPEAPVVVRRRDRREKKPFFPHYLFARLDLNDDRMAEVRWMPGVRHIVSAGEQPVPVPDEVVSYIRHRLATLVRIEPEGPFKKGDLVHIVHGPFEGLDAVFDQRLSPERRVRVLLDLMGRLVATELDLDDLFSPW
jgi:transcriptional antiterminator RfaH